MPRSSRHKSHKQSKHSSKDDRERSDSEEDVKMKDKNGKEDSSVRVSRDSMSGEKRKVASQSRDAKNLTGHGNGDTSEEHVVSKRRKEKADGAAASDRWNGGGDERGDGIVTEKEKKGESLRLELEKSSKSKALVDSKSKTSRRNDNVGEKKEENVSIASEREEVKSSSKVDPKRKSERDSGGKEIHQVKDLKESKEKDRGAERERKAHEVKRDSEARAVVSEVARKQGSQAMEFGEERQGKRGRENSEWPIHDELRNPELEKELEKRIRKRRDGSGDKDKYQDHAKEGDDRRLSSKEGDDRRLSSKEGDDRRLSSKDGDDRRLSSKEGDDRRLSSKEGDVRQLSSRGERGKDGRYKDEKHKDESHGDKYQEDGDIDNRHPENKYREDGDRDNRRRDDKHREDGGKDSKRKDDRHREDGAKDSKQRDDKYGEDGERDSRHKDDKYREDGDRDSRHGGDKYREDGDRDNKRRDDRYREDGDANRRHRDEKYREDSDRDNRRRDDKYWKEGDGDNRRREDKRQEDVDRDNRHKDVKQRDDVDRDKRLRDVKYWEDRSSKDHALDKSDNKRLRGESNVGEHHYRKSSNQDGSPVYDDRNTRYKDDKAKRRANEKEDKDDYSDIRYRNTKEQRSDAEKRATTNAKIESFTERGRSYSRNADAEITLNHNRHRSSPNSSSHAAKDHYRLPKQDGSKQWDHSQEEKVWHDVTSNKEFASASASGLMEKVSVPRSVEKPLLKDELSVERRQRSVSRASPLQLVDKFPSSSSTDRRHLSKPDVRRSLDAGESGQRGGGLRDAREYSDEEGRELPMDELSQVDGDTLSVSSPFTRPNRSSNNSKSPLRPFRTGVDNPMLFGSSEDDNRGRSMNRHRRFGDSNMGRAQGSPWKGVPNWPSPMSNGFMPFQHGPPPLGFHPVMQQFPAPPMFGVRPSMDLNHTGVPYHIPDADRFSGHGRPIGWRNPVDDSCPPRPLHGWDSNNAVFGDESHMYGRPDWDQSRTPTNGRGWSSGMITELPAAPQKQDYSARRPVDEVWTNQSGQQAQNEPDLPSLQEEKIDIDQSSESVALNTLEAPITVPEKTSKISKTSRKDDNQLWRVYLTKLDISSDLTQPELYNQCASLMDVDQNKDSDEVDSKILYVEEVVGAKMAIPNKTSNVSLFAAINDSVFQKAMSLYKKQREETRAITGEKLPFSIVENEKPGDMDPVCDQQLELEVASLEDKAELSKSLVKLELSPETTDKKLDDEPVQPNSPEKSEDPISALNQVKIEADPVVSNQEVLDYTVGDKHFSPEKAVQSDAPLSGKVEDAKLASDSRDGCSANSNEEHMSVDTKCGPLLFTDVSSEGVMPESIESGLVNLSRIHHSPESTH